MDKDSIRRQRSKALSLTVAIETGDRIVEMIARRDGLYAISLDKIIRINLPDDIDPQMLHSDAPIAQTGVLNIGARHPLVARTVIQAHDFSKWLPEPEKQQRVQDIAWELLFALSALDTSISRLNLSIDETAELISSDIEKYTKGASPMAMPIVENLEVEFRSAIFIAKHALNSISELIPTLFDVKIDRGRYDKIIAWAEKEFGKDAPLCCMLRADHNWIHIWSELRNALEHPKTDYYAKINNFQLLANRQPQLPTWELKHPKLDTFRPQNMMTALEFYRNNIFTFFENLLVELTKKAVRLPASIRIIDIDENQRNGECPKRYDFLEI